MNVSRYTIVVEAKGGETLLYNTASGAFAAVKGQSIEFYEEELAALGFLTELDPNQELAGQQALFDAVRANRDSLTLSLIPTYACNYRCPYCYEPDLCKSTGKMSPEVEAGIIRFIEHIFAQHPFMELSVQWYGGEPTLALDVVERLSNKLIAWCSERCVAYDAMMLTNAALIDESAAQMLSRCKVGQVLLTIEGPKEYQDRRRLSTDGSSSFDAAIGAVRLLRANGIQVKAGMNADRLTLPCYDELRERLYREEGIELDLNKLNDYGNTFGQPPFAKPDFDLFTHDEFFELQAQRFIAQKHSAYDYQAMLAPCDRFCSGQTDNYFVIDLRGDVFNCDGWVGDSDFVRFNLLEGPQSWLLSDIVFDASRDEKCSDCEMLPICHGSCIWERVCCAKSEGNMPCHPLKTTMPAYLQAWRDCYGEISDGLTLLASFAQSQ